MESAIIEVNSKGIVFRLRLRGIGRGERTHDQNLGQPRRNLNFGGGLIIREEKVETISEVPGRFDEESEDLSCSSVDCTHNYLIVVDYSDGTLGKNRLRVVKSANKTASIWAEKPNRVVHNCCTQLSIDG